MLTALLHDTIVARATPPGKSALAIIRLSGPEAIAQVAKKIKEPYRLFVLRSGSSIHVDLIAEEGSVLDDVVVTIYRSPNSFSGEDLVEISSHGSPIVAARIEALFVASGCRLAEHGEFSRRALINGKIDVEQLEIISSRIDAESEGALRGSALAIKEKFERLRGLYDGLISLLALVNAQIDFGESDDIVVDHFEETLQAIRDQLQALLDRSRTRTENAAYFTIALVGPPNVGKSSLFNAMLAYERSIVSDVPGTTRDYVEAFINLEGYRVKLVDTAGIRHAGEGVEARGIELGKQASLHADLSFRLTSPDTRGDAAGDGEVLVHNKQDLDGWNEPLSVSAVSGHGLKDLFNFIRTELSGTSHDMTGISVSEGERLLMESALHRLGLVQPGIELSLISEELQLTLLDVSHLLGTNIATDTLNHIFERMCIGK